MRPKGALWHSPGAVSYTHLQLMAKKLTDKNIIILLDTYVFDSSVEEK